MCVPFITADLCYLYQARKRIACKDQRRQSRNSELFRIACSKKDVVIVCRGALFADKVLLACFSFWPDVLMEIQISLENKDSSKTTGFEIHHVFFLSVDSSHTCPSVFRWQPQKFVFAQRTSTPCFDLALEFWFFFSDMQKNCLVYLLFFNQDKSFFGKREGFHNKLAVQNTARPPATSTAGHPSQEIYCGIFQFFQSPHFGIVFFFRRHQQGNLLLGWRPEIRYFSMWRSFGLVTFVSTIKKYITVFSAHKVKQLLRIACTAGLCHATVSCRKKTHTTNKSFILNT